MVIYKAENQIDGKIYIGQTVKDVDQRIKNHLSSRQYFGNALRKYGLENFDVSVIDQAETKEELDEKEKYWIKFFDCKLPNGYNLTDGGDGTCGYRHTHERKMKISKALAGRMLSEEHKQKLSKARKGISVLHSEETKQKISKSHFGIEPWNKGLTKEVDSRVRENYKKPPWNKGLTKETDDRVMKTGQKISATKKRQID